ncbi:hypothetical protein TWF718_003018 [Orbilia javanica]|uniref:Uncharacterized protein n=1 Tax=Orbilia javanica TaxID=47235 RepID=A0AAN8MLP3_9PEZI
MTSFLQRIGSFGRKKLGKNKLGKTAHATAKNAASPPAAPTRRHSFDSRASGSIISIPRNTDPIDDYEDLKPWKKKKNKGKQAHHNDLETITEQMRRDFIALQHKIDRIEAHVVPKTPPDTINLEDLSSAVTTNGIRTFIECATAVYDEGKEVDALTGSVPEGPEDIRNAFVKALERCEDPEFLFKLSQKILGKYGPYHPKNSNTGPSGSQDLGSGGASEPSTKPGQAIPVPQIEYNPRYETEACESTVQESLNPLIPIQSQLVVSRPKTGPTPISGELVPIATHLLRARINATKRQKGELMPHLPIPFGPSPPPIYQSTGEVAPREPKYIGLHDIYAENCIEKLEHQAGQMAQLPRIYTENAAVESTGSRPKIEAAVFKPNLPTKPAMPCFQSSPEEISIYEASLYLETLSISKSPFSPPPIDTIDTRIKALPKKFPEIFSNNFVASFPMSFPDPNFDEVLTEDEESDLELDSSVRYQSQAQANPGATLEPQTEEQQIQSPDTYNIYTRDDIYDTYTGDDTLSTYVHVGDDTHSTYVGDETYHIDISNECESRLDTSQLDETEEEDSHDDEAAAHLRAIHLLILLRALNKRQNESRDLSPTVRSSSNSSGSSTPSDSSERSGNSSNSSVMSQSINVPSSNGGNPGESSKKRGREDDSNENNNPNGSGPPQKKLAIDMIRDILRRFACPFARGKPDEHQGCQLINRQNLSGLKEHVKRKHFNNVLPNEIRIAKSWNEVFLHCNKGWVGPIPSPYISDMFVAANDNQPLHFEPSSPVNDGRYRPIVPLPSPPPPRASSSASVAGPLSQPLTQVHSHQGNYNTRPKQSEPTIGQGMIDFLTTGGFDSIYHLLPPHLQSIDPDSLQPAIDLENYMQSNFGIDVNQTRSQLMTPEFANNLNMLFQQPQVAPRDGVVEDGEAYNQQELVPAAHITQALQAVESLLPPPTPTIRLQTGTPPAYHNDTIITPQQPLTSETHNDLSVPVISPELSHCLDYLFADAKPYIRTRRPRSRLSRSSSSSSSSHPSSSSSSFLLPEAGTQTPDTLLSERNSLDLPPPIPPKPLSLKASPKRFPRCKNKRYSLHIKHKPQTPGSPHQCATFSFDADNDYIELKLAFNDWMTSTFFWNNGEFSWDAWDLEDMDEHERIPSLEALIQNLPFTWTAFRTTEAAFLLVPKR